MNKFFRFLLCAGLAPLTTLAIAAPPQTINYQGYLTNPGGTPVNTNVVMTFKLYNEATAGAALYGETQFSVNVTNGNFNAVVGSVTPITLPFDVPYWLTVAINSDAEMTPRQPLASSPYAFRAASLDSAATIAGSQISGPISTATIVGSQISGTITSANFIATQQLPSVACATNQIPKWNGSAWACAADNIGGNGTVTSIVAGAGLTAATITTSGTINVDPTSPTFAGNYLKLGGNTLAATAVLGTADNNAVEINANGARVMRYEPNAITPNITGGYFGNVAGGPSIVAATIAGGGRLGGLNVASASFSTVGGGGSNTASAFSSTVGGGGGNTTSGVSSTVGGGGSNTASGISSTVGGGQLNTASGAVSTIPGGYQNVASGDGSFAAGVRAKARHDYSFVWNGSPNNDSNSDSVGDFAVYAPSHVRMYAGAFGSGGCILSGASGWLCSSDRNLKTDIQPINPLAILQRVAAMPVSSWSMQAMPGRKQIGPMAQDFFAAFHLGDTDTMISTTDAQGVALAAIQGLNQLVEEKDAEIKKQGSRIKLLEDALATIQTRLGMR